MQALGRARSVGATVQTKLRRLFNPEALAPPKEEFDTESERNLAGFLEAFQLERTSDSVWKLARNGGYCNAEGLHFADDATLAALEVHEEDRRRILLAGWLHLVNLHDYGPGLVRNGITSLARLATCSDETLQRSGVMLMGHRRVLLRQIREDLALRPDLVHPSERKSLAAVARVATAAAESAADVYGGDDPNADAKLHRGLPGAHTRVDLEAKLANRDAWHEPWKATAEACLTCDGGAYYAPKTPREISLACADGTVLRLC